MIEFLRLVDLGIIDEAEVELGPGFTVITGETGAGKTMVLSALDMLLGGKSEVSLAKSENTQVQGGWAIDESEPIVIDLRDSGIELDDGLLLLSRSIPAGGRSKCSAGRTVVTQAAFSEWGEQLVAVHGQSDQVLLRKSAAQREALDRFGGPTVTSALDQYTESYEGYMRLKDSLEQAEASSEANRLEREQLLIALEKIEEVNPQPGELEEIHLEIQRLAHVDQLQSLGTEASFALSSDDDSSQDATSSVYIALRALKNAGELDPRLDALVQQLSEIHILLSDANSELSSYIEGLDAQPSRLGHLQNRVSVLNELVRLHGPSLEDVISWGSQSAQRINELEGQLDIEHLRTEFEVASTELAVRAEKLSSLRVAAASEFSRLVTEELHGLMMADSEVSVVVEPADFASHGADEVTFKLSAHRGGELLPLAKAASGGELSRVMLAMEVVLADSSAPKTMVFDEIDAGVGGKAATQIGKRLAQLGKQTQVIVVTHLPQVAAFADRQLVVLKSSNDNVTTSDIKVVSGEARVRELSRMLAGQEESESAAAHAKELLDLAAQSR